MGEQLKQLPCPYPDMVDNTINCEFTTNSMDLLKMYKRAKHNGPKEIINMVKETAEAKVKEEIAKKTTKGLESKPTRFVADKMREGFKRCRYQVQDVQVHLQDNRKRNATAAAAAAATDRKKKRSATAAAAQGEGHEVLQLRGVRSQV